MGLLKTAINTKVYKGNEYSLVFKNDTSGTETLDPALVTIGEFIIDDPGGMTLKVPLNSCQIKHNLNLYFFDNPLSDNDKANILKGLVRKGREFKGKVIELEKDEFNKGSNEVLITVEFFRIDEDFWNKLVSGFEQKRDETMDWLKKNDS